MSTELAYDLTSSRGVLCPLLPAACVILSEASGGCPTLWLEPSPSQTMLHLLELCKYKMPSALTGIQTRARVALFSEALPPSPNSQDVQELKLFT